MINLLARIRKAPGRIGEDAEPVDIRAVQRCRLSPKYNSG
jgi:hypothetical protein